MRPEKRPETSEQKPWTKAGLTLLRLALVVFLVWVLFSSRFPSDTPFAEDSSSTNRSGRTAAEPAQMDRAQFN
jgi:hypothetical protein